MAGRRTTRSRAVVLDRTRLGEQDLIIRALAENGCLLEAVAKGGRKPGSKVAARVELFCECDLLVASGRGSLATVAESALVNPHAALRGDYERTAAASACCEVSRLTCFQDAEDPFLYPVLARALTACEEARAGDDLGLEPRLDLVVAAYAFKVLAHEGWRPELDACVGCGEPQVTRFSAAAGGALCESCAADVAGAEPVVPEQLSWLAFLIGSPFAAVLTAPCDRATAAWLARTAHAWCVTHLDARLRAMEFWLGV